MLDVGFSEILLTSAIALIVLGPERLPKVARQVGNWMGRARAMARQLSEQLEREVSAEEFLKAQGKPSQSDSPNAGAAFDPSHSATLAPATVSTPPPAAATSASASAETPADTATPVNASSAADVPSPADAPAPAAPSAVAAPTPTVAPAPTAAAPEPVYGLPAALTTAAAMHAADPPAGTHPAHE